LNLHKCFGGAKSGCIANGDSESRVQVAFNATRLLRGGTRVPRREGESMLIILIILLLVFGFGGYRLGPGLGYYGGGGISLIILIVIILLLLKVI
jgi:hypothetical protein